MANIKKFADDFKEFALRGNVIDLAVGIIIGGAFNQITRSIVDDLVMPPIGFLLGKVDFSDLYINLSNKNYATLAEAELAGAPIIKYGSFINVTINFIILALVIFILIKWINNLKRKEEGVKENKPSTKKCQFCISVIPINATRCPNCTSMLNK